MAILAKILYLVAALLCVTSLGLAVASMAGWTFVVIMNGSAAAVLTASLVAWFAVFTDFRGTRLDSAEDPE